MPALCAPAGETQLEVLLDGQIREDPPSLRHECDTAPGDVLRPLAHDGLPSHADVAARRADGTHDRVQRRRLPRAVGADQADDLAAADLEGEPVQSDDGTVAYLEILHGQQRDRHVSLSGSWTALSPR